MKLILTTRYSWINLTILGRAAQVKGGGEKENLSLLRIWVGFKQLNLGSF